MTIKRRRHPINCANLEYGYLPFEKQKSNGLRKRIAKFGSDSPIIFGNIDEKKGRPWSINNEIVAANKR